MSRIRDTRSDHNVNVLLELLPFDLTKKLVQSYFECADYFKELSEYKVKQLESGEKAEQGTMDLMGIHSSTLPYTCH